MVSLLNTAKLFLWDRYRWDSPWDYLNMGLGIEARRERNLDKWRKHLEYSQAFQREQLADLKEFSVAILGAGRLYDVPSAFYSERCRQVALYDWDVGALRSWRAWRRKDRISLKMNCCDVLGTLARWSQVLVKPPGNLNEALEILSELNIDYDYVPRIEADVVISLNILSQLSVYWWDRVERWLGEDLISNNAIIKALERSCARLEMAHLHQLESSGASRIILLADRYLHYYQEPITKWQTEDALLVQFPDVIAGYNKVATDSWFWHIAPQGVEQPDYGEIREVWAISFARSEGKSAES